MKSKHAKIYKNQKQISKKILTLSENPCKTELRCFSDLDLQCLKSFFFEILFFSQRTSKEKIRLKIDLRVLEDQLSGKVY